VSGAELHLFDIPSFVGGLIAFLLVFLLMGVMFFILREDRDRTMPPLDTVGPSDMVELENRLASYDAPYLAIVTLVVLELVLDALIVVSTLQGIGSIAIGTMLALATFVAAAILGVYGSGFMPDAFARKPRLEQVAARQFEEPGKGEGNE
jgi:hypothetical protein